MSLLSLQLELSIILRNDPAAGMIDGISLFEEPGDIMDESSFQVFQALDDGAALAHGFGDDNSSRYSGIIVLLYNEDGSPYYDEQVVDVPVGKCARQIGIYRYRTRMDVGKTVPVVMIMNK